MVFCCTLTVEAKKSGMLNEAEVIEVEADGSQAIVRWKEDGSLGILYYEDGDLRIDWDLPI